MRTSVTLAALASLLVIPQPAFGQRRLVQDTLSASTPGVVSCGFCAGERFAVIFRDLPPPSSGLAPEDFPVELANVEIAVASANAAAGCAPSETGATITAPVEIYAGTSVPPDEVVDLPADAPWPGETLVWAADAPLALSVADETGRYSVNFNVLEVRDELGERIRVDAGVYFRVVVTIPTGVAGSSPACESGSFESPGGFPFRDNAGDFPEFRGTGRRSLIHALGVGWVWNSEGHAPVPVIPGNWGIRLALFTFGPGPSGRDAGMAPDAGADAGERLDAGLDAGSTPVDGGPAVTPGGGCGCRAATGDLDHHPFAIVVAAVLWSTRRRRRRITERRR